MIEKPDLSSVSPAVRTYLEYLEAEIEQLRESKRHIRTVSADTEPLDLPPLVPDESPSPFYLITVSNNGTIKKTPRHLYSRQRRGGMGIFDLETPETDPPTLLTVARDTDHLFCLTNQARTFRFSLDRLPSSAIRSKGQPLTELIPLHPDEKLAVILPEQTEGHLIVVTNRGHIRRIRYHYFGENLRPGLVLFDTKAIGNPVAGCWSLTEADIFIATRQGRAIRFMEKLVPARGCLGIRLEKDDIPTAVTAVAEDGSVFLMGADGKGTIRQMETFMPNKAPGTGGKFAMKTDLLVGAVATTADQDLFAISRLSKIIRFRAIEVPAKEGAVQGVNCMTLRADEVVSITGSL